MRGHVAARGVYPGRCCVSGDDFCGAKRVSRFQHMNRVGSCREFIVALVCYLSSVGSGARAEYQRKDGAWIL